MTDLFEQRLRNAARSLPPPEAPRSVIDQITVLRVGHSANIELFQYEAPDQRHSHPRNSDWSGHHIAFYVTDIDAAIAYMDAKGVERFFGPFSLTDGPAAGQSINYFKTRSGRTSN
jgi:catechol 2,3-dioxygenase-like lactoylglutathione lyase family enzyme